VLGLRRGPKKIKHGWCDDHAHFSGRGEWSDRAAADAASYSGRARGDRDHAFGRQGSRTGSGRDAVVVDVFNAGAVRDAVVRARPEIVIHQLTDLPQVLDPALLRDALSRNSRLRIEGTANLVAAAQAAGARRLIAQSIAFAYAVGPEPHAETDAHASGDDDDARGVRARD
jgi:nucleoside-diphosphate-sugar epimerase